MQNQESTANSTPKLFTVRQFVATHPAFTAGGLYSLIFNETNNGLKKSGVILRIGRKVLIDEAKFFAWISQINGQAE